MSRKAVEIEAEIGVDECPSSIQEAVLVLVVQEAAPMPKKRGRPKKSAIEQIDAENVPPRAFKWQMYSFQYKKSVPSL